MASGVREGSGGLISALWSLIGGLISGLIVLLVGRALRYRGKIRFDCEGWLFRYRYEELNGDGGSLQAPIASTDEKIDAVVRATYRVTVHLFNEKDVRVALRNARVVFLLGGQEKVAVRLQAENYEHAGDTIQLAAQEPLTLQVRGKIEGNRLTELTSGWDEVRLRATRENGSPFDKFIAWV